MESTILLDAGSGGSASQRLINNIFLKYFDNPVLKRQDDAAVLEPVCGKLAMSTDTFTVTPLFFPGASIGSLAINGTVNDIAMLGAKPLYLSCGFIIEEGLSLALLEKIVADMAQAAINANVKIVTGDTKVVPAGACDKIFINTAGIGKVYAEPAPSGYNAQPGDAILVSGSMGDHGLAVMAARENLDFISDVRSDCAPLAQMVENIFKATGCLHTLRDPTRGGLATTLNEIAQQSGVGLEIDETLVPVHAGVQDGCAFLGLDPFYLANEGKCICIVPEEQACAALNAMRGSRYGGEAAIIGRVTSENPGKVIAKTPIGGKRFLGMLEGAQLPRIC